MSKDKSKKKSKKKGAEPENVAKRGKGKESEFPTVAPPVADETAAAPEVTTEDTSGIKKKRKAEIDELALGESHDLPHVEHLYRLKRLLAVKHGEFDTVEAYGLKPKKAAKLADQEIALYRAEGEKLMRDNTVKEKASKKAAAADKVEADAVEPEPVETIISPELDEETKAAKARIQKRREDRAAELIAKGVDPEDAKNRALLGVEAEDQRAAADARHQETEVEVTVVGLDFTMKRKHRMDFLSIVRELTGDDEDAIIPSSGDFGRKVARKKKAKARLDEELAKLVHPEVDTTAAEEIGSVESDDLPAPVVIEDEKTSDLAPLEAAISTAEKLAAQVEADALDPDGHNIDDVLVKNGRPYLVPEGVEWDGEDESVLKPYTRVTNWIDVLDDKSQLTDWKLRTALVGLSALDELDPDDEVHLLDLVQAADREAAEAIAKLDKKSRKGKLDAGEYAEEKTAVERAYKKTVDDIVERALDQGGAFDKAKRGTHLHAVFEAFDLALLEDKKLTVDKWVEEMAALTDSGNPEVFTIHGREVIPADIIDLRAYRAAMDEAGIEVIECERRVVNEAHGTTGTFDRGVRYKAKGATRSAKVIGDVKTGRIDYGAGKIAQQVEEYAQGDYYDPATGKREKTGYSKTVGLLIHSPAGEGRTTIYEVDLKVGTRRNRLAAEVKAERARVTEARAYRGAEPFYTVVVDPANAGLHMTEGQRKKAKASA